MNTVTEKRGGRLGRWFRLCPLRHGLSLLSLALIGAYFLLRQNARLMGAVCQGFVLPWQRFFRRLTAPVPFSVGECLIVCLVLAAAVYLALTVLGLLRRPEKPLRLYRFLMTCLTAFSLIYCGFCYLWGIYYYVSDFEAQSGIMGVPLSTEQLRTVTDYFTGLVNRYGEAVKRDGQGRFREDPAAYFAHAPSLYEAVEQTVPCLAGDPVPPKPFFFSRCMSYINFTGFYFPFTAEANINTDAPGCLAPSTIAHELAHQRGVAEEDEANFVAVLASLADGDPVYCYSACLLAYIHLGNALYRADYEAWQENYARLSDDVRADLAENNAYWAAFKTPASSVADRVYTGFLHSYGQTLGLQTYGKCIDLLVAYYYDAAVRAEAAGAK